MTICCSMLNFYNVKQKRLTILENLVQTRDKVRPNKPVEICPSINARYLGQDCLHPSVHSTHPENVSSTIRTAPYSNSVLVNIRPRLGIRDCIREIARLLCRDYFMTRLVFFGVAITKAAVIIYQAGEWKIRGEMLRERIQVHLFQGREAMRHDEAWERQAGISMRRFIEPAAQSDIIGSLKFNVFAHGGC